MSNTILNEVLKKIQNHNDYLNSIDSIVFEKASKDELEAFLNALNSINVRPLLEQVREQIKEKDNAPKSKHFPIIEQITFLTNTQLNELDDALAYSAFTKVRRTFNLSRVDSIPYDMHDKIYECLIELGVIQAEVYANCPACERERISPTFPKKLKEQWEQDLKASNEEHREVGLIADENTGYYGYCEDCQDSELEIGFINPKYFDNISYALSYVALKESTN